MAALAAALALTACGGGGGGGGGVAAPVVGSNPPVAANPAPQALAWTAVTNPDPAAGGAALADRFHWVTMNPAGSVMAAASIPGTVYVSANNGVTWRAANGAGQLPTANWISVDMTPTGSKMVAIAFGGGMYISNDTGTTWTQADAAFNPTGNLAYESVTMSANGQVIAVSTLIDGGPAPNLANGLIYVSQDGGATFVPAGGSAAARNAWRAIDSSTDGQVMVAASQNGDLHLSTNSGVTFSALPVTVGGLAVTDGWYRVKMSADGNTIAVAGNVQFTGSATGIYVSRDRGVTWTLGTTAGTGTFSTIAMSADGQVMGATLSDDTTAATTGTVLLSTNGGATFAPMATLPVETNWRSIAFNQDATRALLAAGTFFATTGGLYVSSGSITGQ